MRPLKLVNADGENVWFTGTFIVRQKGESLIVWHMGGRYEFVYDMPNAAAVERWERQTAL